MEPSMRAGRRSGGGFTYLALLIAIAVMSVGLMAVVEVWATSAHRERERQLNWVGEQYIAALNSYRNASPSAAQSWPASLDDLAADPRFGFTRRHLRRHYVNPFTGRLDWELERAPNGGIVALAAWIPSRSGGERVRVRFAAQQVR